jgi:hypothetical protein
MNNRIMGTVGEWITFTGILTAKTKKSIEIKKGKRGRIGRQKSITSLLFRHVKTKDGRKFSHVWIESDGEGIPLNKLVLLRGRVSVYATRSSAGTTVSGLQFIKVLK